MMFRPLPVLTLFSAISLGILLLLGNWQWDRYSEKMAREAAGPPEWDRAEIDVGDASTIAVRTVMFGKPVWKIVSPIGSDAEGASRFAVLELIEAKEPPARRPASDTPLAGQTVEGIFTAPPGRNSFSLEPDPENGIWFAFERGKIADSLGLAPPADAPLFEPVELKFTDANGMARLVRNPYADFYQGDTLPPQRHFGYAITWWGLAIALIVIYAVFHHSQGRLRFRKSS